MITNRPGLRPVVATAVGKFCSVIGVLRQAFGQATTLWPVSLTCMTRTGAESTSAVAKCKHRTTYGYSSRGCQNRALDEESGLCGAHQPEVIAARNERREQRAKQKLVTATSSPAEVAELYRQLAALRKENKLLRSKLGLA